MHVIAKEYQEETAIQEAVPESYSLRPAMRVGGENRWYHESNLVLCVSDTRDEVSLFYGKGRKQWESMKNFRQEDFLHN